MSLKVSVVRTGTANLASVLAGLRRLGVEPSLTDHADEIATADYIVLPGVGAFGAAMEELESRNLTGALRDRIKTGQPTLCVCLGMQLLFETSDETSGVRGLGVAKGGATRFRGDIRIPQLGWNKITPNNGFHYLREGYFYFANSYRIEEPPPGWKVAMADYGGPFVAAMERDAVLACQFHPELSGKAGLKLMQRWLEVT